MITFMEFNNNLKNLNIKMMIFNDIKKHNIHKYIYIYIYIDIHTYIYNYFLYKNIYNFMYTLIISLYLITIHKI